MRLHREAKVSQNIVLRAASWDHEFSEALGSTGGYLISEISRAAADRPSCREEPFIVLWVATIPMLLPRAFLSAKLGCKVWKAPLHSHDLSSVPSKHRCSFVETTQMHNCEAHTWHERPQSGWRGGSKTLRRTAEHKRVLPPESKRNFHSSLSHRPHRSK